MRSADLYNVYCDESCHLENDGSSAMALGAVYCLARDARSLFEDVRDLKSEHGLARNFEAKWTKISPAKIDFYLALTNLFLKDDRMCFRGVVVPDKGLLDHERFRQSHDHWYYKMYYVMLKQILKKPKSYRIYLDVKDTQGGPKVRSLHKFLSNKLKDFDHKCVQRVEQVRSHEIELMSLVDILTGALTYANRDECADGAAKSKIVRHLEGHFGDEALTTKSGFGEEKFNIFTWDAQVRDQADKG